MLLLSGQTFLEPVAIYYEGMIPIGGFELRMISRMIDPLQKTALAVGSDG